MYIDLRSDTVTMPTDEMRKNMMTAIVGDDVYDDDPTIIELQNLAKDMLGKEAALFVPSGTFGNQLCIFSHTQKGDEIIVGSDSHILLHEAGASAVIASVQLRSINRTNKGFDLLELESLIRDPDDIHYPKTSLICVENAYGDGTVFDLNNLKKIYKLAHKNKIKVHMDGARIFNAAISTGVDVKEIAKCADSISFCLSKGLCSPVGAIVVGTKKFIEVAKRKRKIMGGGLRQAGILGAAGLVSLKKMTKRLNEDHILARYLADKLDSIEKIKVFKDRLDINMVFFTIDDINVDSFVNKLFEKNIKISPLEDGEWRFVVHNDISKEDIDYVIKEIKEIL